MPYKFGLREPHSFSNKLLEDGMLNPSFQQLYGFLLGGDRDGEVFYFYILVAFVPLAVLEKISAIWSISQWYRDNQLYGLHWN